jgi:hypothetical protein
MKRKLTLTAIWFLAGMILGAILVLAPWAHGDVARATPVPQLSDRQQAWLGALEWCESNATPTAINPKDSDGTPSYGILQFKPSTLTLFETKYNIKGDLMSSSTQTAIVTQMILKGGIEWSHQFPDCVKRLGTPPE